MYIDPKTNKFNGFPISTVNNALANSFMIVAIYKSLGYDKFKAMRETDMLMENSRKESAFGEASKHYDGGYTVHFGVIGISIDFRPDGYLADIDGSNNTIVQNLPSSPTTAPIPHAVIENLPQSTIITDNSIPSDLSLESGGGPTILSAPESNKKGLQACRESNFEMAIQEFKTAVRLNPTNAEYVNNLGYAYEMVGKYASSNYFCKKALDLAPSQTAAFGNLAFNFAKLDQPKQAGDYWDNYIANLHIGPKRQRGLDYLKDRMAKESDPRLTDSIRKALERAGAI